MEEQLSVSPASGHALHSWLGTPSESSSLPTGLLFNVLDAIDYGVIVVRGLGRILFANLPARTELQAASHIRIRNDRLAGCSPKSTLAIERAILEARNGSRRLIETAAGKTALTLSFAPLSDMHEDAYSTQDRHAPPVLILTGRREISNPASLGEFARSHGISNAEKRLLPSICTGASIKDMAEQYGLSACTVRVHLKNIRRKTGTPSLRTLMLQLMALPPVLSLPEM